MDLRDFVLREMPHAGEIIAMLDDDLIGASMARLDAAPLDSRKLRHAIQRYANSPSGPYGDGRLRLYHQASELFDRLRELPENANVKRYELKDSFIGGDEADLIMLKASHEGVSQEKIAHDVLLCSKNAVGERRRRLRDGVRIAGMGISADFSYRGQFHSSIHPISLPLNMSEVYVLFDALAAYMREHDAGDPHARTAERIAGMARSQLSDYANEKLDSRLRDMGLANLPNTLPSFVFDTPNPDRPVTNRSSEQADPLHWVYFEKAGVRARIECADGEAVVGTIVPRAQLEGIEHHLPGHGKDHRPCCFVRCEDGDIVAIPWANIIDIRKAE